MITDKYINHIGRVFRWRKLIEEGVKEARRKKERQESGMPKAKKITDPTAGEAIKNLRPVRYVIIYPERYEECVRINDPEIWLDVVNSTYDAYAEHNKPVANAFRRMFEENASGEILSALLGMSKRVFYDKRRKFLTEAALRAAEAGLIKK